MLSRSPFIEVVGAARDGDDALELVEQLQPDVVTLDLNMPNVNGLDFLRRQMVIKPIPVIVLSVANQCSELVMQALDAGAVDVVQKPTALANDKVLEIADDLIAKVEQPPARSGPTIESPPALPLATSRPARRTAIVVIGVSTGGPQALKQVIPQLAVDFPVPIVVVLHMPVGYTELFAAALQASRG